MYQFQYSLRSAQGRQLRRQDRLSKAAAQKRDRDIEEFLARQVPGDAAPNNEDE